MGSNGSKSDDGKIKKLWYIPVSYFPPSLFQYGSACGFDPILRATAVQMSFLLTSMDLASFANHIFPFLGVAMVSYSY